MGEYGGFGLMDLLASFALFDDDPSKVNSLVGEFQKVTPALVQATAKEYLRPENRTIIFLEPGKRKLPGAGKELVSGTSRRGERK